MKETIYKQADSIKVLALQREKVEHELTLHVIDAEAMRSEISELKIHLAAAEGRNDALRKAVDGMQRRTREISREVDGLRSTGNLNGDATA